MTARGEAIDDAAERIGFSGVVRIDDADGSTWEAAYGDADRAHGIANTTDTIFGLASGGKGFTALTVASLIEDGTLGFDTTARSLLGDDLPSIADEVTVELLLAHRSGIGDYLDEQEWEVTDVVMPVSVHRLVEMEDFVGILDGFPMAFPPDERFAYCNGGFVVLAVLAERARGCPIASWSVRACASQRDSPIPASFEPTSCPVAPRSATSVTARAPTSSTSRCSAVPTVASTARQPTST
jgi:CubicO group peptidase (beta-lactamase class C family)